MITDPSGSSAALCPLCRSGRTELTRTHRFAELDFEYRYHLCRACETQFIHPIPDDDALASLYDRAYYDQAAVAPSPADLNSFADRLARLESLVGAPGRILDVGAGAGNFLVAARHRGWQVTGVEISRFSIDKAQAEGIEIIPGFFETADVPPGPYDVIHAWAVFEHFVEPLRAVRRAAELLRPGGVLVINTVNFDSYNARHFGADWEYCQDLGHLVFPTVKSLRQVLEREGFSVAWLHVGGNPPGFNRLSANNNTMGVKSPTAKRALRGLRDSVLGNRWLRRAAKEVIHLLQLGDAVTVYARRNG